MSPTQENQALADYAFDEGARVANIVRHEYMKQMKTTPEKKSEKNFGGFQTSIRREVIIKNSFKASQEQIKEACARVRVQHSDLFEPSNATGVSIREAISHCITAVLVFSAEHLNRAVRSHKNARKLITQLRAELGSIVGSHRRQTLDWDPLMDHGPFRHGPRSPNPRSSLKNCTIKIGRKDVNAANQRLNQLNEPRLSPTQLALQRRNR